MRRQCRWLPLRGPSSTRVWPRLGALKLTGPCRAFLSVPCHLQMTQRGTHTEMKAAIPYPTLLQNRARLRVLQAPCVRVIASLMRACESEACAAVTLTTASPVAGTRSLRAVVLCCCPVCGRTLG